MSRSPFFAAVGTAISCFVLALPSGAQAQAVGPEIQATTVWSTGHVTTPPLRELSGSNGPLPQSRNAFQLPILPYPRPYYLPRPDGALQTESIPLDQVSTQSVTAGANFEGQDFAQSFCACAPPDPNGAAGTTQYVQTVNTSIAVYSKTGAVIMPPTPIDSLWSKLTGSECASEDQADAVVLFDKLAKRWVVAEPAFGPGFSGPFEECIAVSTSADATGSYNAYDFSLGSVNFPDLQKLGVWPATFSGASKGAYLWSANIFANGSVFLGPMACAYDRNAMLAGAASVASQCFQLPNSAGGEILPEDFEGTIAPPANEPGVFATFDTDGLHVDLYYLTPDFPGSSTITSTPTQVSVPAFTPFNSNIPENSGDGTTLDSVGIRPMYRLGYRNFGTQDAVYFNHTVVGTGGAAAVRWYEITKPTSSPAAAQAGTFSPDSNYRWMGSTAMDKVGDQMIGFSHSNSTLNPSIRVAGRTPADPSGTLQSEIVVFSGGGSQNGGLTRWGDYSAMQIDPSDDCTFWYTQEYIPTLGQFNWHTRIAAFKFPNCTQPLVSLSKSSLTFSAQLLNTASAGQSVTLKNPGTAALAITSFQASSDFKVASNTCPIKPSTLAAGQQCSFSVQFVPSVPGAYTGEITITDNANGSPQLLNLTGTGVTAISFSPASLSFGTVTVGMTSGPQIVKLTNNLTTSLTVSFSASGDYTATAGGLHPCTSSLAAKAQCTIAVSFHPKSNGTIGGSLSVAYNASFSPQNVSLSGSGSGGPASPLTFSPSSLSFSGQLVGTSSSKTVTVTNSSGGTVNISALSASANYKAAGNGTTPCGGSLASLAKCTFSVTFSPSISGTIKGSVAIANNTAVTPQIYNVTGTALSPFSLSPTSVTFPAQMVGTTSPATIVTVTNNQSISASISFTASGQYKVVAGGPTPCTSMLAGKTKCTLALRFSPTMTGTIKGVMNLAYGGTFSPIEVKLSGSGK